MTGLVPRTAFQQGYWECNIAENSWVPYEWPVCSLLEQFFCQGKSAGMNFEARGMLYRVDFQHGSVATAASWKAEAEMMFVTACQLNLKTGAKREVRRWASRHHSTQIQKLRALELAALWQPWREAHWTWLLMEAESQGQAVGQDGTIAAKPAPVLPPLGPPSRQPYAVDKGTLADTCADWWPMPLRAWPSSGLIRAEHPHGRKCNFALQHISPTNAWTRQEWESLSQLWQSGGMASSSKLVGAFRVQNRDLIHGFAALRNNILTRLSTKEDFPDSTSRAANLSVRLLWHGTRSASQLLDICRDGFDRAHASVCVYGKGCYFAASATYSNKYACGVCCPAETEGSSPQLRAMIVAAVIVGETVQGTNGMYPAPQKPHSLSGERYENTVDKVNNPGIFVTYKDYQALPAYIILYEA